MTDSGYSQLGAGIVRRPQGSVMKSAKYMTLVLPSQGGADNIAARASHGRPDAPANLPRQVLPVGPFFASFARFWQTPPGISLAFRQRMKGGNFIRTLLRTFNSPNVESTTENSQRSCHLRQLGNRVHVARGPIFRRGNPQLRIALAVRIIAVNLTPAEREFFRGLSGDVS
jgi:hypothetical protein